LQGLIERSLETVFDCRLVATEFTTGQQHAGRIDTLALSEENNPVIIEYKKIESSELVNQSLYYLSWLDDHRGDFQMVANQTLGRETEVDWDEIRVICIAPGYKKYDLHAVQQMDANIELWQYRLFENGALYLEQVFGRASAQPTSPDQAVVKNPVMVAAGVNAAETRKSGVYTFEQHIERIPEATKQLLLGLRDGILNLGESVEEIPKKCYIAYKVAKNFVCMESRRNKALLYLKLNPSKIAQLPPNARDVRQIGHYGTGDLELTVQTPEEALAAQEWIRKAFEQVGG